MHPSHRSVPLSLTVLALALLVAMTALPAAAQGDSTYYVSITNITRHQIFKPAIAVAHSGDVHLWQLGQPASPELAAVAEDALPASLEALLDRRPASPATPSRKTRCRPAKRWSSRCRCSNRSTRSPSSACW